MLVMRSNLTHLSKTTHGSIAFNPKRPPFQLLSWERCQNKREVRCDIFPCRKRYERLSRTLDDDFASSDVEPKVTREMTVRHLSASTCDGIYKMRRDNHIRCQEEVGEGTSVEGGERQAQLLEKSILKFVLFD